MNASGNKFDALESLIFEDGPRIEKIDVHPGLDLLLIILNTTAIIRRRLSAYSLLAKGTREQLLNYQFIGEGTGIHWPELDEDLSLKTFLRDELRNVVGHNNKAA